MHLEALLRRLSVTSFSRNARRRARRPAGQYERARRAARVESLEDRRVLAVLYVANDSGFNDASHPGSPQAGDTVTWAGGGQFTTPVSNLDFATNAFDSIDAAIAAAQSCDTIEVAPGRYSEQVNVSKSVILLGAQTGVDAGAGRAGASESVVDGQDLGGGQRSTAFDLTASDVTVDGFTVENTTGQNTNSTSGGQLAAGIVLGAGISGAHITDDIVSNNQVGLDVANSSMTDHALIQYDLFENNNQSGGGIGIYSDHQVAGGPLNSVLIDSNKIVGNANAGIRINATGSAQPATYVTITNNTIDSNGVGIDLVNTLWAAIESNDVTNDTTPSDGKPSAAIAIDASVGDHVTNNNLHGGVGDGVDVTTNASASQSVGIRDNSIFGFSGPSVWVDGGTDSLDATENWWGTIPPSSAATSMAALSFHLISTMEPRAPASDFITTCLTPT